MFVFVCYFVVSYVISWYLYNHTLWFGDEIIIISMNCVGIGNIHLEIFC